MSATNGNEREVQVSFRAPESMVRCLERFAESSDRTLSGEIRHGLRRYIAIAGVEAKEQTDREDWDPRGIFE